MISKEFSIEAAGKIEKASHMDMNRQGIDILRSINEKRMAIQKRRMDHTRSTLDTVYMKHFKLESLHHTEYYVRL